MADTQTASTPHTTTPLLVLTALSSYALYLSYQNITRLQQYEEQSEKAAQWSNTAAQRLHKTRSTQTSATLTLILSLVTTLLLPFLYTPSYLISAALFTAVASFFSRTHMARFWNDRNQTQVPFVEKFNEAIKGSEFVVKLLGLLSYAWANAALLWAIGIRGGMGFSLCFGVNVAAWAAYVLGGKEGRFLWTG